MPAYEKTIVVLANSRKMSGRCIAGKCYQGGVYGAWIRPVSERESGEVSEEERQYSDGTDPKMLDVVSIPLSKHEPHDFQQENHVIDADYYWQRTGRVNWDDLKGAIDQPVGGIWQNGFSSTSGINDRIPQVLAVRQKSSLMLIAPKRLSIWVGQPGLVYGNPKRQVRAEFHCGAHTYNVTVTDPVISRQFLAGQNGTFLLAEAVICLSLGELFDGYSYKLAAGIITPQRAASGI
jgi:hypothetical protein